MSNRIYSIDEIRQIIAPIAIKYGVACVFLFGSYARGEANTASDLDFVIEKGKLRGLQLAGMLCDLREAFEKGIDLLTVTGISAKEDGMGFKQRVEKDMVVVYEQ